MDVTAYKGLIYVQDDAGNYVPLLMGTREEDIVWTNDLESAREYFKSDLILENDTDLDSVSNESISVPSSLNYTFEKDIDGINIKTTVNGESNTYSMDISLPICNMDFSNENYAYISVPLPISVSADDTVAMSGGVISDYDEINTSKVNAYVTDNGNNMIVELHSYVYPLFTSTDSQSAYDYYNNGSDRLCIHAHGKYSSVLYIHNGDSTDYQFNNAIKKVVICDDYTGEITGSAFSDCRNLTSVSILANVTTIPQNAFDGCYNLTEINIPDSVTTIGEYAFESCRSLTSINIPSGVSVIDDCAFSLCSSLTAINVDSNNSTFKSVDGVLFNKDGSELICYPAGKTDTTYTTPSGVKTIGGWAFRGCDNLLSVTISSGVTSINNVAFNFCSNLISINIPSTVTSISTATFSLSDSLVAIIIPDKSTDEIDGSPWSAKNAVVYWGDDTTYIHKGDSVYYEGYTTIEKVVICDDYVGTVPYSAFCTCSALEAVYIGNGVTSIMGSAFEDCSMLESVYIGSSVTSIGAYVFSYCDNLISIKIPSSVTSINDHAFYNCNNLHSIIIDKATDSIEGSPWGAAKATVSWTGTE